MVMNNGYDFNTEKFLNDLKEQGAKEKEELESKREKLKQRILHEWNQAHSIFFWNNCFRTVPFETINEVFHNVQALQAEKYPIKNPAGLFVSILKKMGHLKKKEVAE